MWHAWLTRMGDDGNQPLMAILRTAGVMSTRVCTMPRALERNATPTRKRCLRLAFEETRSPLTAAARDCLHRISNFVGGDTELVGPFAHVEVLLNIDPRAVLSAGAFDVVWHGDLLKWSPWPAIRVPGSMSLGFG